MILLAALLVPSLFWDRGPETAKLLEQADIHHICVPTQMADSWKKVSGFTLEVADPQQMKKAPAPEVKARRRVASATQAPWVDSNGWRFLRDPKSTYLYDVSGKTAALAAAEAFAYNVHAFVRTDESGLKPLGTMLKFLCQLKVPDWAPLVNIGFIDDGTPESGEFMNLLVRRNLLFRTVNAPDPTLDLSVKLGTPDYPKSEAGNPSLLAEKVRANLTDDKRLLRIYGSYLVVGRLVGDRKQATLFLLNYGAERFPVDGIRVKVLGDYAIKSLADFGAPNEAPADVLRNANSAEFTLKTLSTFAVVNFAR